MARSFDEVGPDRLVIREGGGCLSVFGLPFLCAGMFMSLAALGIVPMSNSSGLPAYASPVLVLMGLVFTAVGGTLVFGRAWTTVDATRRQVVKEWGLVWPMHRVTHASDGSTAVTIGFESGDSDSSDQYPIFLRSGSGPSVKLASFTDYATSRSCAAAVARHLRLDFEDNTTDHAHRMPAGHAELSLQHRVRLEGPREEAVERPVGARSTVGYESNGVRISIPNTRPHPVALAFMLLPIALPLFLVGPLSRFFRQTSTPDPLGWMFLGFLIFGFGILPATSAVNAWLRSRFGSTLVIVSGDSIVVQERGLWRTKVRATIAAADIIDIDFSTRESAIASARLAAEQRVRESERLASSSTTIGPRTERLIGLLSRLTKGRGVTVKTRQGLTTFGDGLADDEVKYLHEVVRRELVR